MPSAKTKNTKAKPAPRSTTGYPVFRPTVSTILVCKCGSRYIKTRKNQDACVPCFVKVKNLA